MARKFEIDYTITRDYRHYIAVETQLTGRLLPADKSDPIGHYLASVEDYFDYALQNMSDSVMVGKSIQKGVKILSRPESLLDGKINYHET